MAILMVGLVIVGLYMSRIPISIEKLQLYGWHKEWGILALMLAIVRITWRLRNLKPSLTEIPVWERFAARLAHWIFYFLMLTLPVSGWLVSSSADLPVSFFGLFTLPDLVSASESNRILYAQIHEWLGYTLIFTFCLHTLAALKHYFINKDNILQRMLWP